MDSLRASQKAKRKVGTEARFPDRLRPDGNANCQKQSFTAEPFK